MLLSIAEPRPSAASVWSLRLSLFAVGLALTTLLLHRILGLPTPVALTAFAASFAFAGLSLLGAVIASIDVWRSGNRGVPLILAAGLLATALLAWPASQLPTMAALPAINDVSTDTAAPPAFILTARQRPPGTNPVAYRGAEFASLQQLAYPDLQPYFIDRSVDEAFDLALDAAKRLKFKIVDTEPPGGASGSTGFIEASDRTLVIGFVDDIVIRVTGNERQSRVDVRSASRYGRHDFGRNAERTRRFLKELLIRIENTVAGAPGARATRRSRGEALNPVPPAAVKSQQARDRIREVRRKQLDPARSGAQREPAPRAKQP